MNITCPRCGKENPEDVRFCLGCGTDLHGRGSVASSIGRPPPLGVPPRLAPPPPLGAPRPGGAPAPLGPPPGPPAFASGPAPLNAPPPLASNPMGSATPVSNPANPNGPLLGPMPSLAGPPGLGAPPGLGGPPGLGAPPGGGFPSAPLGPPPSLAGAPAMGGLPPLLGAMPPLPGAAPPPVAPVAPAAMPPAMGGLPPLMGSMPALGGAPPAAFPPPVAPMGPPPVAPMGPPPVGPNPFGGAMAPVLPPPVGMGPPPVAPMGPPPVPPMGPPPVAPNPFGGGDPFGSADPFGGGGDAFAASPPDPFAAQRAAPPPVAAPPPRVAPPDPFAAMNNPFASPSGGPLPGVPPVTRAATHMASPASFAADPVPPTLSRSRQATVGPGAIAWPPGAPPSFHQQNEQFENMTEVRSSIGVSRPRLMITQLDGAEQGEMPLNEGDNLIGREVGGIFAEDNLLSSRHATVIVKGGAAWVRDEGSRNGVYIRIPPNQRIELQEGDQFCLGRIILRFDHRPPPTMAAPGAHDAVGYLSLVVGRDVDKNLFPLAVPPTGLSLGRSRSDVRFPNDGWISGLHCQLVAVGPQVFLVDLKSSNGTYSRIRGTRALGHGDALLMGQRIFHVNLG